MFKRILVVLDSAEIEQDLCQVAFEIAKEDGARVQWVHRLQPGEVCDFESLRFLHQQALLLHGVASDITQMNGELSNIIREQLVKWEPDLLIVGQNHFQEISPLLAEELRCAGCGHTCSVMFIPSPETSEDTTLQHSRFELPQLSYDKVTVTI
jgi:hypothetical protein